MAVSQIWSIHTTPGKTLEYVARNEKSEDGTLVFTSGCSNIPRIANLQMKAHRTRYGKDKGVLLHHGFVSFKKNEITKERAYEFANDFMESHFFNYQYFGSIHVDTDHIHFNYVINSVSLDGKKYNRCDTTKILLRAEVDRLCEEYGLSVTVPRNMGVSYKEYLEQKKSLSWKAQIKNDIDAAIERVNSFDEFLKEMRSEGYFIKQGSNVKYMVMRKPGMEKGCRVRKLGEEYTEEAIKDRILYKQYNFIPRTSLRKPYKHLTPVEHELMRLYYRRPTLATNMAMGIHLLNSYITGNRHKIMRYSPPQRSKTAYHYKTEVKKLAEQICFCSEKQIESRVDLEKKIEETRKKILEEKRVDLKHELAKYYGIRESLDSINTREVFKGIEISENDKSVEIERRLK